MFLLPSHLLYLDGDHPSWCWGLEFNIASRVELSPFRVVSCCTEPLPPLLLSNDDLIITPT